MFKQIPDPNGQTCQNRPANHININQPSAVKLEIIFKSQCSLMAKNIKFYKIYRPRGQIEHFMCLNNNRGLIPLTA